MYKLVQYSRDNCSACVRMDVYLRNATDSYIEERHIDTLYELGIQVQAVPVLVLLKDGEVIDFSVGFKPDEINELLVNI